jgi:hypothetical protein
VKRNPNRYPNGAVAIMIETAFSNETSEFPTAERVSLTVILKTDTE